MLAKGRDALHEGPVNEHVVALSIIKASSHVFLLPELLILVFECCDDPTLACCARVKRMWEDIALSVLWRQVKDIRPLFNLLAPQSRTGRNAVNINAWARFQRYASFVRDISLEHAHDVLNPDIIRDAIAIATSWGVPLFPHLTKLRFDPARSHTVQNTVFWLGPSLTHLTLCLYDKWPHLYLQSIAHALPIRSPDITRFKIILGDDYKAMDAIAGYLAAAFSSLPHLETVSLDIPVMFMPCIWDSLAHHPSIVEVTTNRYIPQESLRGTSTSHYHASFQRYTFGKLRKLDIDMSLATASVLFNQHTPRTLSTIITRMLEFSSPQDCSKFLDIIITNSSTLEHLTALFDGVVYGVGMQHMQRVLSAPQLRSLYIRTETALDLSDEDFHTLASALPNLNTLSLSADPVHTKGKPRATLRALEVIAESCARLQGLALYVDTDVIHLISSRSTPRPFQDLKKLSLGLSTVYDVMPVATYLLSVFGFCTPVISSGFSGWEWATTLPTGARDRAKRRQMEWSVVANMVQMLRAHDVGDTS